MVVVVVRRVVVVVGLTVVGATVVVVGGVVVTVVGAAPLELLSWITGPGRSGTGLTWLADWAARDATTANTVAITTPATPRMA